MDTIVTGSSGFIGQALCRALLGNSAHGPIVGLDLRPPELLGCPSDIADICSVSELRKLAQQFRPAVVFHLAAEAKVVVSWTDSGKLVSTNVTGTINVASELSPARLVFASSGAVYGHAVTAAKPLWSGVGPVGLYGMSKAAGELVCRDWAKSFGKTAVILRIGNVVGQRCRGLIPYLVRHAQDYPDASQPAEMRGGGRLVRDYVPLRYVIAVLVGASQQRFKTGATVLMNVGTGFGINNARVADVVTRILKRYGYSLRVDYSRQPAVGEARSSVLDPKLTEKLLGIPPPSYEEVIGSIEEAAKYWISRKPTVMPSEKAAGCQHDLVSLRAASSLRAGPV
jgi:UDP-glucose 4-epimerase